MRNLIYMPIIHASADLGLIGAEVSKKGKDIVGEKAWDEHRDTILGFWGSVARYFDSLEINEIKIYQDGLVMDGDVGSKVVSDGVKRGSKNYEIVSKLIDRGARLVGTEDFALVKREYDYLIRIANAKGKIKKIFAALNYKIHKKKLLEERDKFIAQNIDRTLGAQETGILFLGADHEITSKLPKDIKVIELKERGKIKEYQSQFISGKDKDKLGQSAEFLSSPINKMI